MTGRGWRAAALARAGRVPGGRVLGGLALAGLVLAAPACDRRGVAIELDTDAVTIIDDAGLPALVGCDQVTDLACLNFLDFQFARAGTSESMSHCLPIAEDLGTLCDVHRLAQGAEVFRLDPDGEYTITVFGLRVYPATGCEGEIGCDPRKLFQATTDGPVRLRDYLGGTVTLRLEVRQTCGPREEYYPNPLGRACSQVCGAGADAVVCTLAQGCLCQVVGR